ncbi:MAG: family 78 glycoside hydrolase catalytic domain [Clostridia bacterium]|nr:family 78 glycoside hydrolase catalytic domain [Clostridia bacterium]
MQEEFAVKIIGISCCGEERPVGVFSAPTFFFGIEPSPNFSYGGCQIQVATDYRYFINGFPDMWDSGTVRGEMRPVRYAGSPLSPFTRYYWRVRVLGAGNDASDFSKVGEFVTGAVCRSDWGAGVFESEDGVSSVRKPFFADDTLESAFLFIAASGSAGNTAAAYINGNAAFADPVFPGPAEPFVMYAEGADVTEYIRRRNSLNIDFCGRVSAILKLNYSDGRSETIESGDGWELLPDTPYLKAAADGRCEEYDAVKAQSVYSPDYSQEHKIPKRGNAPMYIRHRLSYSVCSEKLTAVSVKPCETGWLFDFGRTVCGYAETVFRDADKPVVIRYHEYADGRLDAPLGESGAPCCVYHPAGRAAERYAPTFFRTAFRYVSVEGLTYRPSVSDALAVSLTSAPKKAEFSCSDEDLNGVFAGAVNTASADLLNLPTDSQDGNGAGKPGFTLAADAFLLLNDAENVFRRLLESMEDSQSVGGYIPSEFPSSEAKTDVAASMSAIIAAWSLYMYCGDRELLAGYYRSADALMNALASVSNGDLSFDATLLAYADRYAEDPVSPGFLASVFYFRTAEIMSMWCAALRDRDGAEKYRDLAMRIGTAVNEKYLHFTAGRYFYENGAQGANTLALAFGLCPEKARPSVTEALVDDIRLKGRLTVGHIANTYIFNVLSDNGYCGEAYSLVKDGALPAYMRENGVGTFPLCAGVGPTAHMAFAGGCARWITGALVGLSYETPGGRRIRIRPYMPEELNEVSFRTASAYGDISLYWQRYDGRISIDITVPVDCEAVLCLPVNNSRLGNRDIGEQFVFRTGKHHITINDRSTKSL